jgi:hypothetical protein
MFSMPTSVEVEEYPIPMPINFQSMALLYDAMTDRKKISILPRHDDRVVSDYVSYLSLQDQAELLVLADRFDCVNVQYDITSALEASASKNAMELLRRSSEDNLVPLAKIAIRHRGDCSEWRPTTSSGRNTWWKVVRGLRPTWQLELTKLYWEDGFQLVDREEERPRMSSGRAYPRLREVIMRQTRRTYAQIADDFDPPPCKSCFWGLRLMSGNDSDLSTGGSHNIILIKFLIS